MTSTVKSKYSKSCYWNIPVNVIIFRCTKSILLTGFHCIPLRRFTGEAIDVTHDGALIGDVTVRKFDDVFAGLWLL